MKLTLFDTHGDKLKTLRLTQLPISEAVLIDKSQEIYNDPAPCVIRRSAISETFYVQLSDFLEASGFTREKPCPINEIPQDIAGCFCFDAEVSCIACHK